MPDNPLQKWQKYGLILAIAVSIVILGYLIGYVPFDCKSVAERMGGDYVCELEVGWYFYTAVFVVLCLGSVYILDQNYYGCLNRLKNWGRNWVIQIKRRVQDFFSHFFNRFHIFHIWWKFLLFFSTFLFLFIPSSIGVDWIFKTKHLQNFFTGYTLNNLLNLSQAQPSDVTIYQTPFLNINLLPFGGLSNIILIFGIIVGYCAFYEYMKKRNLFDEDQRSEYAKILNVFTYAYFASIFYDCIIIGGYLEGWFEGLSQDKFIEISFLFVILVISCLNIIIIYHFRTKEFDNYENFVKISLFLKKINFYKDFQTLSVYIFFLTIFLPFFGELLSFNVISILFLDFQLIYIIACLGLLNSIPVTTAKIEYTSNCPTENIFILQEAEKYALILTPDNQKIKISNGAIFSISNDEGISLESEEITRIKESINTCPHTNLSKIEYPYLFSYALVALAFGTFLKLFQVLWPIFYILPLLTSIVIIIISVTILFIIPILIMGYITSKLIAGET